MENKVVVHMKDGKIHKGVTQDFVPSREAFHLLPAEGGGVPVRIQLEDMKALFYVKDYMGNRDFVARRQFDAAKRSGRRASARPDPVAILTRVRRSTSRRVGPLPSRRGSR